MKSRKWIRTIIATVLIIGVLVTVRMALCPQPIQYNVQVAEDTHQAVASALDTGLVGIDSLATAVSQYRVILVGETHFKKEVMDYFVDLLDRLAVKQMVVALELPAYVQALLDEHMASGRHEALERIKSNEDCLPYGAIIQWCYTNRDRVKRIIAIDEDPWRVKLMRTFCWDTRNQTMAENIAEAYRQYPDAIVVAYGGQMHMLRDGRYMYDSRSRIPCGARLPNLDVPTSQICSIVLEGNDRFPLSDAWNGRVGAIDVQAFSGYLPVSNLMGDSIFGVGDARSAFQYFVNVGPVTRIEQQH